MPEWIHQNVKKKKPVKDLYSKTYNNLGFTIQTIFTCEGSNQMYLQLQCLHSVDESQKIQMLLENIKTNMGLKPESETGLRDCFGKNMTENQFFIRSQNFKGSLHQITKFIMLVSCLNFSFSLLI